MERFNKKQNFNIASTVINENVRVSTAAVFYESNWFGDYWQLETWVFIKGNKGSKQKIHKVPANEKGLEYCKRFHDKTVAMVKYKNDIPNATEDMLRVGILHAKGRYYVSNEGTKSKPLYHVWIPGITHATCDSAYNDLSLAVARCNYLYSEKAKLF